MPSSSSNSESLVADSVLAAGAEAPAASPRPRPSWFAPLGVRAVWVQAAKVALPVGLLQDCINQGDFWLRGEFTGPVIAKSLLTPLVTLTVGLLAAASTCRCLLDEGRRTSPPQPVRDIDNREAAGGRRLQQ